MSPGGLHPVIVAKRELHFPESPLPGGTGLGLATRGAGPGFGSTSGEAGGGQGRESIRCRMGATAPLAPEPDSCAAPKAEAERFSASHPESWRQEAGGETRASVCPGSPSTNLRLFGPTCAARGRDKSLPQTSPGSHKGLGSTSHEKSLFLTSHCGASPYASP